MNRDYSDYLPLSPATMHVLLALSNSDLHGYGIMVEVARQSGGQYKIGPGTLYDNVNKLLKLGLVEECQGVNSHGETRREYHLTQSGSAVLAAETERLARMVREVRRSLRLREERQS